MKATSVQKLISLGCGNEIIKSQIDRGNIKAQISNAKSAFKYFKYCISSNICTEDEAIQRILIYYNNLMAVEYLANVYGSSYQEDYCKIKLQIEKAINS